jgi:hypothetical protein
VDRNTVAAATWTTYWAAKKGVRLGEVEATDERAAIEKAIAEYNVPGCKLMAVRRR